MTTRRSDGPIQQKGPTPVNDPPPPAAQVEGKGWARLGVDEVFAELEAESGEGN